MTDGRTYWYCCSACKRAVLPDKCSYHPDAKWQLTDGEDYWDYRLEDLKGKKDGKTKQNN